MAHEASSRVRWERVAAVAAWTGLAVAALAAAGAIVSGPGYRGGWWELRTGFTILRYAAYGGVAAFFISLLGAGLAASQRLHRPLYAAAAGLVIGVVVAYFPWSWQERGRSVPRIHDITTDLESPPEFVAVLPLRAHAPNPAEYGGPEIAEQQRKAYPELGPARLELPPAQAFERALEAARAMGWEIVDADREAGRIEATATTFWFGFQDDVVVRILPADGGSRVDVRSVSRVGRSDFGTNAERIRRYLEKLVG